MRDKPGQIENVPVNAAGTGQTGHTPYGVSRCPGRLSPTERRRAQQARWRDQKRRQRKRERDGEGVAPVRYTVGRVNKLVRLGCLPDRDTYTNDDIARAFEKLIDAAE